jgi:hypothetical protein
MAGAVPRPSGSMMKFSAGSSGAWAERASTCSAPVTTKISSGWKTGAMRSTACSNMVRSPINLSDCLGRSRRLSGHSRVPTPPAMISA